MYYYSTMVQRLWRSQDIPLFPFPPSLLYPFFPPGTAPEPPCVCSISLVRGSWHAVVTYCPGAKGPPVARLSGASAVPTSNVIEYGNLMCSHQTLNGLCHRHGGAYCREGHLWCAWMGSSTK